MTERIDIEVGSLSLDSEVGAAVNTLFSRDLLQSVANLVLTTTFDGVWLINASACTSYVNQRMAEMLGYSVDEMVGVPLLFFMDDEGRKAAEGNLQRRQRGVQEQHEFKCIRKDGTPIWLLVTANPVYDRAGNYAGALALIADLSIQKAREQTLLAEKAELERRVASLTATQASFDTLVSTDALTGLHSRNYFDVRMAVEIDRCQARLSRVCLLLLDVDGLSQINSAWGFSVGDQLLRSVGQALAGLNLGDGQALLRPTDIAARYSGGQFAILALETGLQEGHVLAERILQSLRELPAPFTRGNPLPLSFSIGVATFPFHAPTPAGLVITASFAMHKARRSGGNKVCLAEPNTCL